LRFDGAHGTCYTIVGITETARRGEIIEDPVPQYYVPMTNLAKPLAEGWSTGSVLLLRSVLARPRASKRSFHNC